MGFLRKINSKLPDQALWNLARAAWVRIKYVVEEWWIRSGGLEVKPSELTGLVVDRPLTPTDAARSVLDGLAIRAKIDDELVTVACSRFPVETAELIEDADRIVQGRFRILGQDIDYSTGIQWHLDPRHNHAFDPGEVYWRVRYSDPSGGFDVKYPWELSRLQHLPRLALAHRITGDAKYLHALIHQTKTWLMQNPVGFGPNWGCTMDVSIRAANMALAFAFIGSDDVPSEFAVDLSRGLIAHGRFIVGHLEWSEELTGNHYLADIAGLAVLGCLLELSMPEAATWKTFAREQLEAEIQKQVYSDGWDFEASTSYHRLVLESFLVPAILMDRFGEPLSERYRERLRLMAEFVRDITLHDGSYPLIGDNDSGLFVSLQPRHLGNLNYLLALSTAYLGDPPLKPEGLPSCPEILWLIGDVGRGRFDAFEHCDRSTVASYPFGGLWIIRSKDGKDMLTFRLGPVGQNGNGGHAHNDQLSITIWLDGNPLIIDPGTACYTSDPQKRNLYRSTKSHATITIGDVEQNRFVQGSLFTLPQEVVTEPATVEQREGIVHLEGVMKGYGPWSGNEVRLIRTIKHNERRRRFEIEDEIRLSGNAAGKTLVWHFPLAPGLIVKTGGTGHCRILTEDGAYVAEVLFLPGWTLETEMTAFAPAYGEEVPNTTLRFVPPADTFRSHFIIRASPGT